MTAFVLVHGAWHGAWCWRRIVPRLEAYGHKAVAADLPGMGADTTPLSQVTLQGWAAFVAAQAATAGERVVLVGHSRGGVVISEAAELAPEALAGLIYLTGILLPDGGTVAQLAPHMPPEGLAAIRPARDGLSTTLDLGAAPGLLYNATPAAWIELAIANLGVDPNAPNVTPQRLTSGRYGKVPRAYIECLRDRTLPIELQRRMQASAPCRTVAGLDTDHSPFFSAPDALCETLIALAAQQQGGR